VVQLVEAMRYKPGARRFDLPAGSLIFFIVVILQAAL
jgi:hypothetical protein